MTPEEFHHRMSDLQDRLDAADSLSRDIKRKQHQLTEQYLREVSHECIPQLSLMDLAPSALEPWLNQNLTSTWKMMQQRLMKSWTTMRLRILRSTQKHMMFHDYPDDG